jgi:hypothetical protein
MDSKITAEWARKESDTEINKVIQKQLEICEKSITESVYKGKRECFVYINMVSGTGDELRKRGFEVNDLSSQIDGDTYKISWY